jgi:hypothetical protein
MISLQLYKCSEIAANNPNPAPHQKPKISNRRTTTAINPNRKRSQNAEFIEMRLSMIGGIEAKSGANGTPTKFAVAFWGDF